MSLRSSASQVARTTSKAAARTRQKARVAAERTAPARQTAATYITTTAGAGQQAIDRRSGSSLAWAIIGYSLLAILVYIAIADKPVVSAIGGATGLGTRVVGSWVKPIDPLAAFTNATGLKSTPSTSGTAASAPPVPTPAPTANKTPLSPTVISHTPVRLLERRYGVIPNSVLQAERRLQRKLSHA